jgi:hypothetical protein
MSTPRDPECSTLRVKPSGAHSRSSLPFKPRLLTDNTLALYHIIIQGCLEFTERRVKGGRVGQICRETHRRALLMWPHRCHRADPTNTLRQILEATETDEAKGYIEQIKAAA